MVMITRRIANKIINSLSLFPVVGLVGPRQVGKTTLVKLIAKNGNLDAIYLDLEKPSDYEKLENPELFISFYDNKIIIIDEVQLKPELFNVLRSIVDENKGNNKFILLGSASPEFLAKSSDSLAGRIRFIELKPVDLTELTSDFNYRDHWFYGGFPKAVVLESRTEKSEWISAFVKTYIERDLNLLGFSSSSQTIRKLWTMIANQQGGIWNASSFSRSLGVSSPTVSRYMDFLVHSFMVLQLQPWLPNLSKRLIKSPKVYIRDSGILHNLLSISDFESLTGNVLIGASWEGYVISQILSAADENCIPYYYRTQDGTEIDLVLTRSEHIICCIEIKFSSSPKTSKSFTTAIADLNSKNNFIITPESDTYPLSENAIVCSLRTFLTQYLPKMNAEKNPYPLTEVNGK